MHFHAEFGAVGAPDRHWHTFGPCPAAVDAALGSTRLPLDHPRIEQLAWQTAGGAQPVIAPLPKPKANPASPNAAKKNSAVMAFLKEVDGVPEVASRVFMAMTK
jgi:hypothetical protein